MVGILRESLLKLSSCLCPVAETKSAQSEKVMAVSAILPVHVLVEDQELRHGNREVVRLIDVLHVILSVVNELVEAGVCGIQIAKLPEGQPLKEDHVRGLVIVVHGTGGVSGPERSEAEALLRTGFISCLLPAEAEVVIDLIILRAFQPALAFIREHITDELSVSNVADYVHLSPYYFNRLFKKRTGFTPHDYILNLRLNNACYLLRTTEHTVKEICFLTGFQSESAFCQSFKHVKGVTPSEYREGSIRKN